MFEMPHLDNIFINYVLASRPGFTRATTEVIQLKDRVWNTFAGEWKVMDEV